MLALDHGCAVFEGEVIPQGGTWQRLQARDPELMKQRSVAVWFEQLGDRCSRFATRLTRASRSRPTKASPRCCRSGCRR
jgi:hypothetical protein